jgi:2-C-methyl-D-erythritol 4-phosphate cytidylyltransferase
MTATPPARCFALVPAAGVGARSGATQPKQYVPVAGQAVIAHTLAALRAVPRLAATLVVLSPSDPRFAAAAPRHQGEAAWTCHDGGATRAQTVAAGLAELRRRGAAPGDWVLVHDAVRCLVRPEWIERLIDACIDDAVGGLLALPLSDTLKQEAEGRATTTLPREGKWAAQTPQMFRLGLLADALARAGDAVTDEASAVEALGLAPRLVPGDAENFKLTWPQDFERAARLLGARAASAGEEIKAFVPAVDLTVALHFYAELGFTVQHGDSELALLRRGGLAFLLQRATDPAQAQHFAMHLLVADLDAWWQRILQAELVRRYGVRAEPPAERPWGLRDLTLTDPSGVLWRIAQRPTTWSPP